MAQKNELKNYAIKEERKKLYEERIKMNKLNEEEREEMKIKIKNIINDEKNFDSKEKTEDNIGVHIMMMLMLYYMLLILLMKKELVNVMIN